MDAPVITRPTVVARKPAEAVVARTARVRTLDGFNLRQFNWPRFTGLCLITMSGLSVVFGACVFVGWLWSVVFG